MGFYGNVFYQLANAFGKFIIQNNGIVSENFPDSVPTSNTTTPAIGLDATYHFDTGNKWIRLIPDAANAITKIYHSPIMENATNVNNINTWDKSSKDESAEQLIAG
jgi:hypothetical protein